MSIKKLFDAAGSNKNVNYSDYANEKEKYKFVESAENAEQISLKNNSFTPQIDYSDPKNFVQYGSAFLFYQGAMKRISDFYPYDGSGAEKNKFYNGLLEGEKYIFNNLYPSSTGYVILSVDGWGTRSGAITSDGYGLPTTLEYITFKGGPLTSSNTSLATQGPNPDSDKIHYSNIYDENIYQTMGLPNSYGKGTRLSNLRSNFDDGVTAEFWLKKPAFDNTKTQKEVVLDVWNNYSLSTGKYGRITLELTGAASNSPFLFTVQSGTTSTALKHIRIGNNITPSTLTSWGHYAFSFQNSGSSFVVKLYKDGALNDTNVYNGTIKELNSKGLMGRIGALLRPPSGSAGAAGAGKLSASLDEFRFWKVARNSQQISRNWFTNVNGGTNTDISNTTLGIYYKFNEGIIGSASIDSVVLDYGGRLSNGHWRGYTATSRNTGSAIVSASAGLFEEQDPIIRVENPKVIALSSSLLTTGSYHDINNNSSFLHYMPSWIIEEHEENGNQNLKIISHIMGSYFDKLYLLAREFPKVRQAGYFTSSVRPVSFGRHLPQSLGMYMPDTFIDASIVESLLDRNNSKLFQGNLEDTKNEIYVNLYNNLANIFKSKGTGKAIRNVFRCFNIDEAFIHNRQYSTHATYELDNNLKQRQIAKKFLSTNNQYNLGAVLYQKQEPANSDSSGYISGSFGSSIAGVEDSHGATLEASVTFPFFMPSYDVVDRRFLSSSLFGVYTVNTGSARMRNGTCTTYVSGAKGHDYANFQIFAVRDKVKSKNVKFVLTSSRSPFPVPTLTSSVFFGVYNNNDWNFSVRIKPQNYPLTSLVSGSTGYVYDVIFKGTNSVLGTIINSFEVSSSVSRVVGQRLLQSPKRIYAGAHRQNITGTISQKSDVLFSNVKYWTKYLDDYTLSQHSKNIFNSGISGSYRNVSPLQTAGRNYDLLNLNTLALNWNFEKITTSDATGNFYAIDFSSGSATTRNNFSWLGKISGYQHTGYGYGFITSSTKVIERKLVNTFQFVDPEQVVSDEMINILDEDDKVFDVKRTVPSYLFTLEKSMYSAISDEMLKFFAGVIDFNNVIGEPVNRYRDRYKSLEKLKEIFFRRVTKTSNVEKFVDYYKWFDDALSVIISQLVPASADFIPDTMNMIEPHVLERDKYQTKFPTLEFQEPIIESAIKGITEATYDWELGHSPLPSSPRSEQVHLPYWKNRANRTKLPIKIDNATVNTQRENIRKVSITEPYLSRSLPTLQTRAGTRYVSQYYGQRNFQKLYKLNVQDPFVSSSLLHGGVNFAPGKNIQFTYNALSPAGPIDKTGGRFVPKNVLLSFASDLNRTPIDLDPKPAWKKVKRYTKVLHGRDYESGVGYKNVKSSIAFPFNIVEVGTKVKAGYQSQIGTVTSGNITITNLHNDVYGPDMEVPMQGPFTNYAVGGHQSRHVKVNYKSSTRALDNWKTRPEAWKILIGVCVDTTRTIEDSGAIAMVGADYPTPTASNPPGNPYPLRASQKAVYYRDFTAKRPVNIRNIKHTTGSTILGNYEQNYQVVSTFGASSNPRQFIEQQPTLPPRIFENIGPARVRNKLQPARGPTSVRTLLDIRRSHAFANVRWAHFNFLSGGSPWPRGSGYPGEYSIGYLTGTINKTVIRTRFAAPGGIEIGTPGYNDFKADEFSVYNNLNYRNLMVKRPFQAFPQNKTYTSAEITGSGPSGISVFDIHGKDYGLYSHLTRHSAKFGRDSVYVTGTDAPIGGPTWSKKATLTRGAPGATYTQLPSFHKINRNRIRQMKQTGDMSSGTPKYGLTSVYDNGYVTHQIPRSTLQYLWITSSYKTLNDKYGIVESDFVVSSSANGFQNSIDFVSSSEAVSYTNSWLAGLNLPIVANGTKFTINVPTAAGGSGTTLTISYTTVDATGVGTVGVRTIGIGIAGGPSAAVMAKATEDAINGMTNSRVSFPSSPDDASGGFRGVTATQGAGALNSTVDLAPTYAGTAGNSIVITSTAGTNVVVAKSPTRAFGGDRPLSTIRPVHTDFVGLNLNTFDKVFANNRTLSSSTGNRDGKFINTASFIGTVNSFGRASMLNALILNRQGPYGWPSWKRIRQTDNKLMRHYRATNRLHFLSSTGSYESHVNFEMPPVSLRGRPLVVALEDQNQSVSDPTSTSVTMANILQTYKADFSNKYVYFNKPSLENQFDINYDHIVTAGEQLLEIAAGSSYELDWIMYTENIFPSQRNEFLSQSRNKVGYNNKFWKDNQTKRITLGNTFDNSQDYSVSQSAWILDAPSDFLTRNSAVEIKWPFRVTSSAGGKHRGLLSNASGSAVLKIVANRLRNNQSGSGELQNTYSQYFLASGGTHKYTLNIFEQGGILTPGALYARKHTLASPRSVVSPSGITIAATASGGGSKPSPFAAAHQIDVFGGEAVWQAGELAGIVELKAGVSSTSTTSRYQFVSKSSKPWFNSYEDYNYLIKKVSTAKEFAIVPEYRISDRMPEYLNNGISDESDFNTFSIPETKISSSDSTFYIDYSNSEFLKDFLKIDNLGLLKAREIRLVCSGTIRFNPYKGFYPAQRTLDLVNQFYKSYGQAPSLGQQSNWGDLGYRQGVSGSIIKALYQPLFAPGILYNSIKSGMAVDWPIVTDFRKIERSRFGGPTVSKNNYAITIPLNRAESSIQPADAFWDQRLPFETIISPEKHMSNTALIDMDTHPSSSVSGAVFTFNGDGDNTYTLMARNFFGAVADFYLDQSDFTRLNSKVWSEDSYLDPTKTYMARIKLRRSMTGSRDYSFESGSTNCGSGFPSASAYVENGGRGMKYNSGVGQYTGLNYGYPLPQNPRNAGHYKESFVMYSRPSAFGPPIAGIGRPILTKNNSHVKATTTTKYQTENIMDSFTGFNPAYTPPYYDGEAWCDLIFKPKASADSPTVSQKYTLAQIMAETSASYWRFDAGLATKQSSTSSSFNWATTLIYDAAAHNTGALYNLSTGAPYGGTVINKNSMQLSASIDLFGLESVENVVEASTLALTSPASTSRATQGPTVATGDRWVIKSKFETPMLNFGNKSQIRALRGRDLSLPTFAKSSVPRGMWHQFGIMEPDATKGIFLEIEDIPSTWLKWHYDVKVNDSVYNGFDASTNGSNVYKNTESLSDLLGFNSAPSKKLGELKDSLTVYEAIIAVPYIIDDTGATTVTRRATSNTNLATTVKKFISIPQSRYEAALDSAIDTATGDSLDAAGMSIRRQVELMQKYILPPELDFVSNPAIDPLAMYIFEFSYTFDKDDLSYMWQNLAPREYKKITKQATSVSHSLIEKEILLEENLKDNENLRWMIFKVKQRSQADYYNLLATQLGEVPATIGQRSEAAGTDFNLMYNWPYDFLSFVEKIKIDAQIIFREDHEILVERDELEKSKQIDWAKTQADIKVTHDLDVAPNTQVAVGTPGAPWQIEGQYSAYAPMAPTTDPTTSTRITDVIGRYSSYRPDSSSDDESGGGGDSSY
jgi:hypothetical protein